MQKITRAKRWNKAFSVRKMRMEIVRDKINMHQILRFNCVFRLNIFLLALYSNRMCNFRNRALYNVHGVQYHRN